MEKTEAVSRLKKAGYQVQFDSSVVTVILPPKVNTNQEIKKLRTFLEEIGYHCSFGIKHTKGKQMEENMSIQELQPVSETEMSSEMEPLEVFGEAEFHSDLEKEEVVEIGEQFSLEDFGIS